MRHFLKERELVDSGGASCGGRNNGWRDLLQDLKGEDTTYYVGQSKSETVPLQTVVCKLGSRAERQQRESQLDNVDDTFLAHQIKMSNMFRPKSSGMLRQEWMNQQLDIRRRWAPPLLSTQVPVPLPASSTSRRHVSSSKQCPERQRPKPWEDHPKPMAKKWHGSIPVSIRRGHPMPCNHRPLTAAPRSPLQASPHRSPATALQLQSQSRATTSHSMPRTAFPAMKASTNIDMWVVESNVDSKRAVDQVVSPSFLVSFTFVLIRDYCLCPLSCQA